MHEITFRVKRAHLRGVLFCKRVVRKIAAMTPARYDLLHVVRTGNLLYGADDDLRDFPQNELRDALGLHPSTVSKMLKRLVEIGWVTVYRDLGNRRRNTVRLTEAGVRAIDRAMRIVKRQRPLLRHFEQLFGRLRGCVTGWRELHVLNVLSEFISVVRSVGGAFGDTSSVEYYYGQGAVEV